MLNLSNFRYLFSQWHSLRPVPEVVDPDHGLVVGCSHTAGVGLAHNAECFPSVLSELLDLSIYNLGQPSGNHLLCAINIKKWLFNQWRPRYIIAQWPGPVRTVVWKDQQGHMEMITDDQKPVTQTLLKLSEHNIMQSWIDTIISINLISRACDIPVINIYLGSLDTMYHDMLLDFDIMLHQDAKTQDNHWLFDSRALDSMHHSAACHRQWAQRIKRIIDEVTS